MDAISSILFGRKTKWYTKLISINSDTEMTAGNIQDFFEDIFYIHSYNSRSSVLNNFYTQSSRLSIQVYSLALFTLEDEQIVWTDKSFGIFPSNVNLCRTVVELFVWTDKPSGKNRLSRRPNFRRFVRRKICSSRFHIRRFVCLRRFVRPDDLFVL